MLPYFLWGSNRRTALVVIQPNPQCVTSADPLSP